MNDRASAGAARRFFIGASFPLFVIAAAATYELFLAAIAFLPANGSFWGGFAAEFKQWCFNYDPRTGTMEWAQVVVMLIETPTIALIAVFLWRRSLRDVGSWQGLARRWRALSLGVATAAVAVGGLFLYGRPSPGEEVGELPFPGERIRAAIQPPAFRLEDQRGNPFSLEDARGRVVLVTGVYAMCSTSCPEILISTKALLDSLPVEHRRRVTVVAISLNPEYDTTSLMERVAQGYGFGYPQFRYLNGEPERVFDILARLGFSRWVDRETGVVNHSNLFLLLDADGKIAYRFGLDSDKSHWLRSAAGQLAEEAARREMLAGASAEQVDARDPLPGPRQGEEE